MALRDLINSSLVDNREFAFGQVWLIPDELVIIPDADRKDDRVIHKSRVVLIVSNNAGNTDPLSPIVTIVPLSHRVDCMRLGDVELYSSRDGLVLDSIARVRLMQPVLKADLIRQVATISDDGIEEVFVGLDEYFGLT